MSVDAILLSKYKKNRPENAFREVVRTREIYEKKWRIFRAQNFSGVLRNTRKSFRELCETVSGPEKFSGLLRNARLDGENDAIWKCWRHQNRHDRAPDHSTVRIQNSGQTLPCGFNFAQISGADMKWLKGACVEFIWACVLRIYERFRNGYGVAVWTDKNDTKTTSVDANLLENGVKQLRFRLKTDYCSQGLSIAPT